MCAPREKKPSKTQNIRFRQRNKKKHRSGSCRGSDESQLREILRKLPGIPHFCPRRLLVLGGLVQVRHGARARGPVEELDGPPLDFDVTLGGDDLFAGVLT